MSPPSPPWSDLSLELAGLVLCRLPAHVDRVRFAAVCTQWRAAAREVTLPSPMPLLALPDGTVYSLPGSEPLRFPRCTGYADACGNWLAFSTESEDGWFMKDPFSNATVALPQLFCVRTPRCRGESETWVGIPEKLTLHKLVFCSGQLVAAFVKFQNSTRVAVCQPGVTSWWSVHVSCKFSLSADMAFHQGKLYITNGINLGLFAIDIVVDDRTGHPWLSRVQRVIPSHEITGTYQNVAQPHNMLYLVEFEPYGALLMVLRKTYSKRRIGPSLMGAGTSIPSGRVEFEVFRADFQQSKWTKVTTIGDDQVLFLQRRCSKFFRVSPEEMPGDRIVFLDKDDEDHDRFKQGRSASYSCKVYDMRDGTVSPFVPSVHWEWERTSAPATWLVIAVTEIAGC